ncbi:hypothetical protein ACCO45_009245 [Purpureocillium lilacinum]|uniref:Uncharacterized protein n=1 Tax=Purpureocillium lilacinum TaxID=33203 RepID=A0ACC4DLJ1_PURLI
MPGPWPPTRPPPSAIRRDPCSCHPGASIHHPANPSASAPAGHTSTPGRERATARYLGLPYGLGGDKTCAILQSPTPTSDTNFGTGSIGPLQFGACPLPAWFSISSAGKVASRFDLRERASAARRGSIVERGNARARTGARVPRPSVA